MPTWPFISGPVYIGQTHEAVQEQSISGRGGYNAGPEAVQGWIAKNGPQREWDQFVEKIPYARPDDM